MPCYRCGAREADPARGSRLWVRAVRADIQVLVCPECQESSSWSAEVDHCPTCDGTNLVRRLGETVCRTCESSATTEFLAVESTMDRGLSAHDLARHMRAQDERDLSTEVASAIDRVLGRLDDPTPSQEAVPPPVEPRGADSGSDLTRGKGSPMERPTRAPNTKRGKGRHSRRGKHR